MKAAGVRKRRGTPEADLQRAVVRWLRLVLPGDAIVHHSPNETGDGSEAARKRQAVLVGMGVFPGFADVVVLARGRVLFLELKSPTGSLSDDQKEFRRRVWAQGLPWALVRSLDDAADALDAFGISYLRTRGL